MVGHISKAYARLAPGVAWICQDGTYESTIWPEGYTPPTLQQVEVEMARADVPDEVWAGAMMRALSALDLLDEVDAIVAASGDLLMQKLWNRAAAFKRDDPMIEAVGAAVDPPWTESDLDDLFRLAGSFNT